MSGTETLRQVLVARHMGRASLARDLGVSNETLHAFAHGTGTLPPAVLEALAIDWSGGSIIYDPAIDRLRPAHKAEPKSQGHGPAPFKRAAQPHDNSPRVGPQPVKPQAPQPKVKRPGWAE